MAQLDLGQYQNRLTLWNRLARAAWGVVWATLFRPTPRPMHAWRRMLLRLFGATIGKGSHPYPTARVWAPWNLTMGNHSCLADSVNCYNVAPITIGSHVTVSQYSYLCTATHDIADPHMRLLTATIRIENQAWVCADVFVGPGVTIGEGAVVGARSSVFKDLPAWKVCVGNPAAPVKDRVLRDRPSEGDGGDGA